VGDVPIPMHDPAMNPTPPDADGHGTDDRQPSLRTAALPQVAARALPRPDMITAVIRQRVRADHRPAYEAWLREVIPIAGRFPGHRGVQIVPPGPGALDYTITIHFDTLAHAEDWFGSEARQALLQQVQPLLDAPEEVKTSPASVPPPRRLKQALATLSVIFPLTSLLGGWLAPQFHEWLPSPWGRLAGNLSVATITVGLMTYVIMPRYTRLISRWLST
jgi:uncharacterized protein